MKKPFEIVYRWADSAKREAEVVWAKSETAALEIFGRASGLTILEVKGA